MWTIRKISILLTLLISYVGAVSAAPILLYHNDGSVNDFDQTYGDIQVGIAAKQPFDSGGFLDGSSFDIAPFNTDPNLGIVFNRGGFGGLGADGGGFRVQANTTNGGATGAILLAYGSFAKKKGTAASKWQGKFKRLGATADGGVIDLSLFENNEADKFKKGGFTSIKKYRVETADGVGAHQGPADDLDNGDLAPFNSAVATAALAHPRAEILFWNVSGAKDMKAINVVLADIGYTSSAFDDFRHHIPYFAILEDVNPTDFGILQADANFIQFDGNGVSGDSFVGQVALTLEDFTVPTPSVLVLFFMGMVFLRQHIVGIRV